MRSSRCVPCGTSAANAASGIDKNSVHAAVLIPSSSHDKMTHRRSSPMRKLGAINDFRTRRLRRDKMERSFKQRASNSAFDRHLLMSKKALEQKLAALETLRAEAASPQTV